MHKLIRNMVVSVMTVVVILGLCCSGAKAEEVYYNYDNGYVAVMNDEADLLEDSEERALTEVMSEITNYGNVAITTIDYNMYYSTEEYIKFFYWENFGTSSGTVFAIDMDYRNIWIYSDGEIYRTIDIDYANTITDNVYTYASAGDYYTCCDVAMSQILTVLEGGRIAQPMKYISNLLLAMIIAMLINYVIVRMYSRVKEPSHRDVAASIDMYFNISNPNATYTHSTEEYSPQSSGSSGGGGGGGGGSSGGGGGHSF